MTITLANHRHAPMPVDAFIEPPPAVPPLNNKLSKLFSKIKNTFKPKLANKHTAPALPAHAEQTPLVAQEAPTITLPSPVLLLPLNEALSGIDRQLASLHMIRADNIIEKYDRQLTAFYGTTLEDTEQNAGLIHNVKTLAKERNAFAFSRNIYAQGKSHHRMDAIQGPGTERAQKHLTELDNSASALNDAMADLLQKSAGRQPTPEIERDYLSAHKALSTNRNAWLTGALDQSSTSGLRLLTLTGRVKPLSAQALRSTALQSSQLRKQLELNVTSEKNKFDNQPALFAPNQAPALDTWTSTPFYELDSSSAPVPTGAQLNITHLPATATSTTRQTENIQRHISKLDTEIEQIDRRLERLSNGRPDPLKPEQLQFIRNAISQLRNIWAAGELTQSSTIGKVLKPNNHDLRRKELEQRVAQARKLDSTATPARAINPALSGSALETCKGHVKRCDDALSQFDRVIYKAGHTRIEGVTLSQNVFEAREAMMQLRNAWASGELIDTPAGAKPQGLSASERRAEFERQVQARSLVKLEVQLPEPPASDASEAVLNRIKFASKTKIIKDINHELADAYLKIADPTFISQDHSPQAHAQVS